MTFHLDHDIVVELIEYVDENVRSYGCDHSHRFAEAWANCRSIAWDDLLDALESHGAYCDCELVANLDESRPLICNTSPVSFSNENRWLLPPGFNVKGEQVVVKVIIARANVGRNTHAKEGEWLIPAPIDAVPRKRVRKIVHFFIGIESGYPCEIGIVTEIPPISLTTFSQQISNSAVAELHNFDSRVASFLIQKISHLPNGTAVGADIVDRVGIASRHREMNIHKVFFKR